MNASLLLAFWIASILLIVVPGPDWAFILASSLRERAVFSAVAGLMIGYAILTVFVVAGLAALLAGTPVVLTVLTVVGAGYLIYLGIGLVRAPGSLHRPPADVAKGRAPRWQVALRGVWVSGLNPKGLLIFLAILPQFADQTGGWPYSTQLAVLGSVFVVTCGIFYVFIGLGAHAVLRTRPRLSRLTPRISGIAMIAIGALLLTERLMSM